MKPTFDSFLEQIFAELIAFAVCGGGVFIMALFYVWVSAPFRKRRKRNAELLEEAALIAIENLSDPEKDMGNIFEIAYKLEKNHEYERAIELMDKIVEIRAGSPSAAYAQCTAERLRGLIKG